MPAFLRRLRTSLGLGAIGGTIWWLLDPQRPHPWLTLVGKVAWATFACDLAIRCRRAYREGCAGIEVER